MAGELYAEHDLTVTFPEVQPVFTAELPKPATGPLHSGSDLVTTRLVVFGKVHYCTSAWERRSAPTTDRRLAHVVFIFDETTDSADSSWLEKATTMYRLADIKDKSPPWYGEGHGFSSMKVAIGGDAEAR